MICDNSLGFQTTQVIDLTSDSDEENCEGFAEHSTQPLVEGVAFAGQSFCNAARLPDRCADLSNFVNTADHSTVEILNINSGGVGYDEDYCGLNYFSPVGQTVLSEHDFGAVATASQGSLAFRADVESVGSDRYFGFSMQSSREGSAAVESMFNSTFPTSMRFSPVLCSYSNLSYSNPVNMSTSDLNDDSPFTLDYQNPSSRKRSVVAEQSVAYVPSKRLWSTEGLFNMDSDEAAFDAYEDGVVSSEDDSGDEVEDEFEERASSEMQSAEETDDESFDDRLLGSVTISAIRRSLNENNEQIMIDANRRLTAVDSSDEDSDQETGDTDSADDNMSADVSVGSADEPMEMEHDGSDDDIDAETDFHVMNLPESEYGPEVVQNLWSTSYKKQDSTESCAPSLRRPSFWQTTCNVRHLYSRMETVAHSCLNFLKITSSWFTSNPSVFDEKHIGEDLAESDGLKEPEAGAEMREVSNDSEVKTFLVVELTVEQLDGVNQVWRKKKKLSQVIVEKFNISIRRSDLQSLMPNRWVNDEVINYYMELLKERSLQNPTLPVTYAFSTFFFVTYCNKSYAGVEKWTRNVDILSKDLIIFPIHLRVHWALVVANLPKKTIVYYDSLGWSGTKISEKIRQYLESENNRRGKNLDFSTSSWQIYDAQNIPRQLNGDDCGVFMMKFAELLSRNEELTFSEADIIAFRYQIAVEIMEKRLLQ